MSAPIEFYVDGACSGNHDSRGKRRAGAGVLMLHEGNVMPHSIPLPGADTNCQAELFAIIRALELVPDRPNANVRIYTDSAYAIDVVTGAKTPRVNVGLVMKARKLAAECGICRLSKVTAHADCGENNEADRLARLACQ